VRELLVPLTDLALPGSGPVTNLVRIEWSTTSGDVEFLEHELTYTPF